MDDMPIDREGLKRLGRRMIDEAIELYRTREGAKIADGFFDMKNQSSTFPLFAMASDWSIMAVLRRVQAEKAKYAA